jgi:Flp pilus assembly protein TadD
MLRHLKNFSLLAWFVLFSPVVMGEAAHVGRAVCMECHQEQSAQWAGSHHDLAMQHADMNSVLGDFSNTTFRYAGITTTFYKKNEKFMVSTDGPDGNLHDYQIKYTFGVSPLQQYLIELNNGRLQALLIAWDSREKSAGGQRWFHLYPDEAIDYQDELHWTGPNFNWNGMCAECHSTNLQKNYDSATNAFESTWSEIDVSCEACHGPASNHLEWANKNTGWQAFEKNRGLNVLFDERKDILWTPNQITGTAERSSRRQSAKEIEVCAQCHSRRSAISTSYQPGKPFADHYRLRLLDQGMYFADGQIEDEVYVHGSFLQSRMYHAGVTCSDCHQPHSLELRQQGNGVCLQCHAGDRFNTAKHHFHESDSQGAQCVACHMPERTYMVVDPRRDHSLRIPRPDLSLELGIPNACNACHADKGAAWAADNIKTWYGHEPRSFQSYALTLHQARLGTPGTGSDLAALVRNPETPDIARATAITHIGPYLDADTVDVLHLGLADANASVRTATVSILAGIPLEHRVRLVFPMLNDPVRSVRVEAARILADVPRGDLPQQQLTLLENGIQEYIAVQLSNAERPEAQSNLGGLYIALGEFDKAKMALGTAIELSPAFVPAYVNLADLYRGLKDETNAEKTLRRALKVSPDSPVLHHVLGLSLFRQQRSKEAVDELRQAAQMDPNNTRYVYVYAVVLNSTGDPQQAIMILQGANAAHPDNVEILQALVSFHRDLGNQAAARKYAEKLQAISP